MKLLQYLSGQKSINQLYKVYMDAVLKIIALLFIAGVLYDRYTPLKLFKRKKYTSFPLLTTGVTSASYEIVYMSDAIIHSITFDARHGYFLIARSKDFVKFNAIGKEIGRLPREESHELPAFSHYVISDYGIYDLSQEKVTLQSFETVLNEDRLIDPFELRKIIRQLYTRATIVLFSKELAHLDGNGYCIYFNISNRWTKVYTEKHASQLNVADYYPEEAKPGDYRSKYFRLAPLKDIRAKVYSDHTREGDWYRINQEDYIRKYKSNVQLTTLFFQREEPFGTIAFTEIPISWKCEAYYKLKYNGEQFFFQEKTIKPMFRRIQQYYFMLELPAAYQHQSSVWFLVLDDPFNVTEYTRKGTYMIRPKH